MVGYLLPWIGTLQSTEGRALTARPSLFGGAPDGTRTHKPWIGLPTDIRVRLPFRHGRVAENLPSFLIYFVQRALAALRAISVRCFGDIEAALAMPPFRAPLRPKATAA